MIQDDIFYFIGNVTSHINHALPLYEKLGGTFIVLSKKARQDIRSRYNVPVVAIDNKPYRWQKTRWGVKKPMHEYLEIDSFAKNTIDYLNDQAKVVIFYELFSFQNLPTLRPASIFLTHGYMLKNYMGENNRLSRLSSIDYMAALGPKIKTRFINDYKIDSAKLIDIGIARTDRILNNSEIKISDSILHRLRVNPKQPILAYMPTFWGSTSVYDTGLDIIDNWPDNYQLLFRPHPQTPSQVIKQYLKKITAAKKSIYYIPEKQYSDIDLPDIINASSAILGDVSSVLVEAAISDKPILIVLGATHQQTEANYNDIRRIVDNFERITPANIRNLSKIIGSAIKQPPTKAPELIFNQSGGSVEAIANFINKIA